MKFDFIIVGGGTTGLAVAARLSDNPDPVIGVIEAGEHKEDNNILIPGLAGSTLGDPAYDWLISTVPQTTLNDRVIGMGRGKVLGGTSALNFLGYQRASAHEYDGWEALGNPGWNFDNMLPFMKRAEKWTSPNTTISREFLANDDPQYHGITGSISTTGYGNFSDLVPPFFTTMEKLGVSANHAADGGHTVGTWSITATMDPHNRTRSYSANGYYEPVSSRRNLVLLTSAQAVKVALSDVGEGGRGLRRATSIEYVGSDNVTRTAHASREIILSSGSIKTPQLLELSGIGNATLLKDIGITALIDLPGVGENLQDHPGVVANFETFSNITTWDELTDPATAQAQFEQYVEDRTGLYSAFSSTVAYVPWSKFLDPSALQSIKKQLDDAISSDSRFSAPIFELQRRWAEDDTIPQVELILFAQGSNTGSDESVVGKKFYTISALFEHPWSRGSVHVSSADGLAAPVVDPKYLQSPSNIDLQILVGALKYALKISQTMPMKSLTTGILGPDLNSTDDALVAWTRDHLSTNFHLVGTAAMLPREHNGVVDPTLTVYGTSNLRVVDASIFPIHIATHPVGTLYGLGERAAALIAETIQ